MFFLAFVVLSQADARSFAAPSSHVAPDVKHVAAKDKSWVAPDLLEKSADIPKAQSAPKPAVAKAKVELVKATVAPAKGKAVAPAKPAPTPVKAKAKKTEAPAKKVVMAAAPVKAAAPAKAKKTEAPAKKVAMAVAPVKAKAVVVAKSVVAAKTAKSAKQPVPAKATKSTKAKVALMSYEPRISPPLHDGGVVGKGEHQSDKKFFGPPFPADYPEDKRPVPDKSVMDKLRGPGQPYPALQSKHDYDKDFVKDENSDTGSWKAQFEYDYLRNKMAKEAADQRNSQARADKEGRDFDDAQGKSDRAGKDVNDAQKGVDDAKHADDDFKRAEDFEDVPPSAAKLEEMKKAVKAAEANLEKEKAQFEVCKKQLEEAKKNLEELKAAEVAMEQKLAADTKLWVESKSVRMNLHKVKEEAAHAKKSASDSKLKEAKGAKAEMDKVLAGKKANHDKALMSLEKEKADLDKAKKDLEKATLTLQKLRGYKPVEAEHVKSGAYMALPFFALVTTFLAM